MLKAVKDAVQRAQFDPGYLGFFVNPFFFARRGLRRAVAELGSELSGRILDVGCGGKPYEALFNAEEYVGLEYDSPANRATKRADFFYDGGNFPFEDGSFDAVFFSEVFEHVFNPDEFLSEVRRVLRPGGRILLTVPFAWDEHEQPRDYARYSSFGLAHLLAEHGFQIVRHKKTVNDLRAVFQLLNAYTFKKTRTGRPYLDLLATIVLMAPVNLIGEVIGRLFPSNDDFYLDNVVVAERR
jgi:SAM-dependent methyltransferase